MTPKELAAHKSSFKTMNKYPTFKPLTKKNNGFPKPLDALGRRKGAQASGLIKVSGTHSIFFLFRDGEILTDRAFYGYLFCHLQNNDLSTIFEFHWHPSHKGLHCKLPCRTSLSYVGRLLVNAPELSINMSQPHNPAEETGRQALIRLFCKACGVTITISDDEDHSSLASEPSPQGDLFQ